jgi:hypothetical protein
VVRIQLQRLLQVGDALGVSHLISMGATPRHISVRRVRQNFNGLIVGSNGLVKLLLFQVLVARLDPSVRGSWIRDSQVKKSGL